MIRTGGSEKETFLANIFFMSVLQASNYILPLITFPYLVRILGPEYFGLVAFANVTVNYFILLTDYGFNLSATRLISINRANKSKISEIFSSVMIIKSILLMISFLIFVLLISNFERFSEERELFFVTFLLVVAQVLFPVWFFQGMEQMKYITFINVGSKVIFTVAIFIFINEQKDYVLVPLLTAVGATIAGIWSLTLVKYRFAVSFNWQSLKTLRYYIIDGWYLFYSSIAISFYTTSIAFILGLISGNGAVGVFSAVEKIVQAAKGIYIPISKALYPLVSKKLNEDKQDGLNFIFGVGKLIVAGMVIISLLLFVFSDAITFTLLGDQYDGASDLLKIMAFIPLILAIGDILSVQIMFNLGYQKEFTIMVSIAAVFGIITALIFIGLYSSSGAAFSILCIEIFITSALGLFLYSKKRKGQL